MTNADLRAMREQMGLTVAWCAANVGRVSMRSWQFWEAGRAGQEVGIPDDVQAAMRALVAAQAKAMGAVANRRIKNDL